MTLNGVSGTVWCQRGRCKPAIPNPRGHSHGSWSLISVSKSLRWEGHLNPNSQNYVGQPKEGLRGKVPLILHQLINQSLKIDKEPVSLGPDGGLSSVWEQAQTTGSSSEVTCLLNTAWQVLWSPRPRLRHLTVSKEPHFHPECHPVLVSEMLMDGMLVS